LKNKFVIFPMMFCQKVHLPRLFSNLGCASAKTLSLGLDTRLTILGEQVFSLFRCGDCLEFIVVSRASRQST
jgi:hypothetical protein